MMYTQSQRSAQKMTQTSAPAHPPCRPAQPIRLHSFAPSGHCHRVALLLSLLNLPHEIIAVDLPGKAHKRPEFLAMNPFGQVPVIEDGDVVIGDSFAIMTYLVAAYGNEDWTPRTVSEAADQQRWFAQAAGPLAFGAAAARAHLLFGSPADLSAAQARARAQFAVMNTHLAEREFLLGDRLSLADLAHYAYVARAPEGGIALDNYPHIQRWLAHIEALPRFVPMPKAA